MNSDNCLFFFSHKPNKKNTHIYSQWWPCNFTENVNGKDRIFISTEQAMMYKKAILFNDLIVANKILKSTDQASIKKYGRLVSNFDSDMWNKKKFKLVVKSNIAKFSQNIDLKNALLSTESKILVEASPYDKVWGVGLSEKNAITVPLNEWPGENLLGKALMQVRQHLQN